MCVNKEQQRLIVTEDCNLCTESWFESKEQIKPFETDRRLIVGSPANKITKL